MEGVSKTGPVFNPIDPTQDPSSSYYLHPSDSASTKLVSVVFDGTGYTDWKRSMKISLDAKNKMCFVDGSLPKPIEGSFEEKAWKRCNNMVMGWIIASLERLVAKSVMYFKTSAEIWNDLEGRYGTPSTSQMYRLQETLLNTIQEPGMSIANYFTRVKSLWDEIDDLKPLPSCNCHPNANFVKMQQDQRIMTFLMKLDPQFNQVRTNLLMTKELPDVTEVYRMLLQEESHKELSKVPILSEPMAFSTDKRKYNEKGKKPSYFCDNCKISGHSIERCFKIHGYPNKNKPNTNKKYVAAAKNGEDSELSVEGNPFGLSSEQFSNLLSFLEKRDNSTGNKSEEESTINLAGTHCLISSINNSKWIVDSGATDHICNNLSLLINIKDLTDSKHNITIPDGSKHKITKIGDVQLNEFLILKNVLFVPNFHFNLISVGKICLNENASIIFSKNFCLIQDHLTKISLPLGKLEHGLYYTKGKEVNGAFKVGETCHFLASMANKKGMIEHAKLWHVRMGHAPFFKLKVLFPELDIKSIKDTFLCTICPASRQSRLPFHNSNTNTTHAFDLLHIDIWGPYIHKTYNGCAYFLTVVDDYTRITWVYLMKNKNDCVACLNQLFNSIPTQFNKCVKIVRTDNAKELCEGKIAEIYQNLGIEHQKSCRDTPQQNGVVERKHKHLLETARALYFQSNVPNFFWGDCILCAAYIINRLPLQCLNNISPYQKMFGKPPNTNHMKSFGCLCFVSTLKQGRTKFQPRATPCIFIGYPYGQKAYKVYDIKNQKVLVSRDIVFHEKHYPYHLKDNNPSPFATFYLPSSTTPNLSYEDTFIPTVMQQTPRLSALPNEFPQTPIQDITHTPNHTPSPPSHVSASPPYTTHSNLNDTSIPTLHELHNNDSNFPIRRSTRMHKTPSHLSDYICQSTIWCNVVAFSKLPNESQLFFS